MSKKQDAIGDWNGPLDVELQEVIHGDCQQIAGLYPLKAIMKCTYTYVYTYCELTY